MTTSEDLARRARRAYELGRASRALRFAAGGTALAALGLLKCAAPAGPIVCAIVLGGVLWGFLWRGEVWAQGARAGWCAGLIPCWAPAVIRLNQEHCGVLCAHLVMVCALAGLAAGGAVALQARFRARRLGAFLVAAGTVALLAGTLGCITAGLAAAGGMTLALCAGAVSPLLRVRPT